MVAAPDGRRWVVEARRPRLGEGSVALLVVRTLAGAEVWREILPPDADVPARVATLARSIEAGGWPGETPAPRAVAHWSPTLLAVVWVVVVTPLTLLAWIAWIGDDTSAAAPFLATLVWAGGGLALTMLGRADR